MMGIAFLKKPKHYIALSVLLVFLIVIAVLFHPEFQKKLLLKQAGPLVDSLQLDYIHITPWSVTLKGVNSVYKGGKFKLGEANLRFCLSSLLTKTIYVKTIEINKLVADLRAMPPAPKKKASKDGPFPGVLNLLNDAKQGFAVKVDTLNVDARILPSKTDTLNVKLTGGGIKPGATSKLHLVTKLSQKTNTKKKDHLDVQGDIGLKQLADGKFAAVNADLALTAALKTLPKPEQVNIGLAILPGKTKPTAHTTKKPSTGDKTKKTLIPERIGLVVMLPVAKQPPRLWTKIGGQYDGNTGIMKADYQLKTDQRLIIPYLDLSPLPLLAEHAQGKIEFNTTKTSGDLILTSKLDASELNRLKALESLPKQLQLNNTFRVALAKKHIHIDTFTTQLLDDTGTPRLSTQLAGAIDIAIKKPKDFLKPNHTLLDMQLQNVPVQWLNVIPDHQLTGGSLNGAFRVATRQEGTFALETVEPLQVKNLILSKRNKTLFEGINIALRPDVEYTKKAVTAVIKDFTIKAKATPLAKLAANAKISLDKDNNTLSANSEGEVYLDKLTTLPIVKTAFKQTLPKNLALKYNGAVRKNNESLQLDKLTARLSAATQANFLKVDTLKSITLNVSKKPPLLITPGELATIVIQDFDLDWLAPFIPDRKLSGQLANANFVLAANSLNRWQLEPRSPLRVIGFSLEEKDKHLVKNLDLALKPQVRFTPSQIELAYQDLKLTQRRAPLLATAGTLTLPGPDAKLGRAKPGTTAAGEIDLDLREWSKQPIVTNKLGGTIQSPVRLHAQYRIAQNGSAIEIGKLAANLFYTGTTPRLSLVTQPGFTVRTQLAQNENVARLAVGSAELRLNRLSPEPFADILKAKKLNFSSIDGHAILHSDGAKLSATMPQPIMVSDVEIKGKNDDILRPFAVKLSGNITSDNQILKAKLDELSVLFDRDETNPTIAANMDVRLRQSQKLRIDKLDGILNVDLPKILDQPGIMPQHKLTQGKLAATLALDNNGKISALTSISDLVSNEPLALQTINIPISGNLNPNGGFTFNVPVTGTGKSGQSTLLIKLDHPPKIAGDDNEHLAVNIDSTLFYLNDILNTIKGIKKEQPPEPENTDEKPQEPSAPPPYSRIPDTAAFWGKLPYATKINFNIKDLYYTDYLIFNGVSGVSDLNSDKLVLQEFVAFFHDSPIKASGNIDFVADTPDPYRYKFQGDVQHFDLNKFFSELTPGSKPQAEGLFSVNFDSHGASPNLSQIRNDIFMDLQMNSKKGVLRPLPPDSVLFASSSQIMDNLGEGLSYIPTGGFGIGIIARLVGYIRKIKYDRIDIHVLRDQTRDLQVKQLEMQSKNIFLFVKGGIQHQKNTDLLDSPLSLNGGLDMRRRGAAILYSMNLLHDQQNPQGYWVGPEFKVWGSLRKMETNFSDIIRTAGDESLFGGIIRPLAGIIGNFKYQWMEKETKNKK